MLPLPSIVKLIAGLGIVSAFVDMTSPADAAAWVQEISHLGMTGLLAVAVIVLWKKLQEKDSLLMANYKSMADSLASNKALSEKMSETLDRIEDAVERLVTVRAQLDHSDRKHS